MYIDEVVPASVALTLTAYMGLGMFVMALILLVARGDFSWRKEAAKSQVYASALAFLASAFLVGLKTKHTDSLGGRSWGSSRRYVFVSVSCHVVRVGL